MPYYIEQERRRKEESKKEKERLYYLELSGRIIERRRQLEAAERERSGASSSYSHSATRKTDAGNDDVAALIIAIGLASILAPFALGMFLSNWTGFSLLLGSGLIWFIVLTVGGTTYYSRRKGWISAKANLYPFLAVVATIAILVNAGWWLGTAYP